MAIKVGQVRKDNGGSTEYITEISHELTTYKNVGVGNTHFDDFAIRGNFVANETYYVRVLINRIDINENMGDTTGAGDNDPHNLNIDIRLYESSAEGSAYQTIDEPILVRPYYNEGTSSTLKAEGLFMKWCADSIVEGHPPIADYVDPDHPETSAYKYYQVLKANYDAKVAQDDGRQTDIRIPTQTVELVFTPYKTAQFLVFQLRRVAYDYTIAPRIVTIKTELENRDVATVNNILPRSAVNKIGIQSRPGSLVVINKEPMRIGRSGTLEINNGISVYSVSMVAPLNQVNEFILDYTYNQ